MLYSNSSGFEILRTTGYIRKIKLLPSIYKSPNGGMANPRVVLNYRI